MIMKTKEKKTGQAPPEVKAKMRALLDELHRLDIEIDSELASLKQGLLELKQEVINKLADRPEAS